MSGAAGWSSSLATVLRNEVTSFTTLSTKPMVLASLADRRRPDNTISKTFLAFIRRIARPVPP